MTKPLAVTNRQASREAWRNEVYQLLAANPGCSARQLAQLVGINEVTLRTYLNILNLAGAVSRQRAGCREYYYTALFPCLADCQAWAGYARLTDNEVKEAVRNAGAQPRPEVRLCAVCGRPTGRRPNALTCTNAACQSRRRSWVESRRAKRLTTPTRRPARRMPDDVWDESDEIVVDARCAARYIMSQVY